MKKEKTKLNELSSSTSLTSACCVDCGRDWEERWLRVGTDVGGRLLIQSGEDLACDEGLKRTMKGLKQEKEE